MNVTYMLLERFKRIKAMGLDQYILQHKEKAEAFRNKINEEGNFPLYTQRETNSLTTICLPEGVATLDVIKYIKESYGDYIAPNPTGESNYLRISHMGNLTINNLLLLSDRVKDACIQISNSKTNGG